ncbi:hypothetical protein ACLINW_004540 [Vibrio parahaemolyticus]|uniref:hypothetical protein n=1 Tax=Vibrio parahaemolyticus TaxID=670 RepID=UPI00221FFC8E|nr:hypothetical protein [Vibrio parahaemolyticus]EJG1726478.1 hypothetical protein [Vibrio parahaemolyticus]EJG1740176.1 hypothetical protein [Vibrio parahaemolyticus]EJG1754339.1 hypothetical protein [Vibrio parahaemolyticus]EJG1758887.1 hypothetical protein [Vibrio parahaemolyticus]UYW16422.1 hypothetical protein IF561_04260 [Vibrio parahaemolyticus]
MKPLGTNNAAENGLTTPKNAFGNPISQYGLSTKSQKPRGTYHSRENVLSASKSAFVPNKLTERSCNQKQIFDAPDLSAPKNKTTARTIAKLGLKTAENEFRPTSMKQ